FSQRDELYERAKSKAAEWKEMYEDQGFYFPIYSGSRLRILGNIAYDRQEYEEALDSYLEAYQRMASKGGYSRYMLPEHLIWLQERIDLLDPDIALKWCARISDYWEEHHLDERFPEMLDLCAVGRDSANWRAQAMTHTGGEN
ncbi:MAG: hypothetical protein ACRD9Y_27700, partial [Blastocatellia bacterium]